MRGMKLLVSFGERTKQWARGRRL